MNGRGERTIAHYTKLELYRTVTAEIGSLKVSHTFQDNDRGAKEGRSPPIIRILQDLEGLLKRKVTPVLKLNSGHNICHFNIFL